VVLPLLIVTLGVPTAREVLAWSWLRPKFSGASPARLARKNVRRGDGDRVTLNQ